MPVREIAEVIGRHLNLPARSLPAEEFGGMLVPLLSTGSAGPIGGSSGRILRARL